MREQRDSRSPEAGSSAAQTPTPTRMRDAAWELSALTSSLLRLPCRAPSRAGRAEGVPPTAPRGPGPLPRPSALMM